MAKQTINQGTAPTGAGGDTFRTGSAKLQANDDELYTALGANASGVLPTALPVNNGGTGATTAAAARTSLGLGTAATATLTTARDDSTAGRVLKVGDFGIGHSNLETSVADFNTIRKTGFYGLVGSVGSNGMDTPNKPAQDSPAWWHCITNNVNHAAGVDAFGFELLCHFGADRLLYRRKTESGYKGYVQIRDSSNTTVDSNGFVKSASPIIELYADHIEPNDEASQQDITFEKVGTGDYLLKGSSGFAQTGWYVETPKDANGNVLFSVIYTTLENGDISVKTYKKKFDFETASIVADLDNPVDITENRWIDLRLQELPQPESEVKDDPEQ